MSILSLKVFRTAFLSAALFCLIVAGAPKDAWTATGVYISDPSLPPLAGVLEQWPANASASYAGTSVLNGQVMEGDIQLQCIRMYSFRNISRTVDGSDLIGQFDCTNEAFNSVQNMVVGAMNTVQAGKAVMAVPANGIRHRAVGLAGKTTGTFPLVVESFDGELSLNNIVFAAMRTVAGRSSTGSITITDRGAGDYRISGYLDVYTEGSLDIGALFGLSSPSLDYFQDQFAPIRLVLKSTAHQICGTLFLDQNSNGIRDASESGLANVSVSLSGTGVSASTRADDYGNYCYGDWNVNEYPVGVYTVSVDPY